MKQVATGSFIVNLPSLVFEGQEDNANFGRRMIEKQISGDLFATTRGQMLSATTATAGSAAYVALELVEGQLDGKQGSFVLHHLGRMERGEQSLEIKVVPDSGTGQLQGISGDFSIRIENGQHFYTFEYQL